jgi:hypothetical protein
MGRSAPLPETNHAFGPGREVRKIREPWLPTLDRGRGLSRNRGVAGTGFHQGSQSRGADSVSCGAKELAPGNTLPVEKEFGVHKV